VAVGDFSGDGIPDVVTANSGDDTVSVLLGDGHGTFGPAASYPVGTAPSSVAVGDFNGDGIPDIVTANFTGNTVSVLLGDGHGTFQPATTYNVGKALSSVAVGDFNHDGTSDLATANSFDGTVSVQLGRGDGTFQTATPANGIARRTVPFLQYLDGDGVPDELILNSFGDLLFRRGLGPSDQFAPPVTLNSGLPARDATAFRAADGWAIAAANESGNRVSLYDLHGGRSGAGSYLTGSFPTGDLPVRIAATDLTGDGLDDLVVANAFDNSVTIALQQSDGTFVTVTRPVGPVPSDIAFLNVPGQNGPDVVISDQVSGDFTVLVNDSTPSSPPTFSQEYRYRAGAGLFDISADPNTGEPSILSQLQTAGLAAGDFTGSGSDALVVLNRGARGFTLLPTLGQGRFADPLPGNTYFPTGSQPSQVVPITLPGDTLPSVAVLMEDLSQVWIYRTNGDGTFAPPVKVDAGNAPTGFSVARVKGQPALLVGNAFGDILTLLYDGHGGFAPEREDLRDAPLAVGTLPGTGQQYAVVANQQLDQVAVYFRKPGTNRFGRPIPISSAARPLLAPGAVQLFTVPGDPEPYLAVANRLSNNVLVFHGPGTDRFGAPAAYAVGFNPVSITVADLNGDGVPDLIVANYGSNDVSVLIGAVDPTTHAWTETPYQRLNSGGSGPIAVTVRATGGPNGPDLVVTNSDGRVVVLPGIGSGGRGSGFFQGAIPQTIDLGKPIVRSSFDPSTGQLFVVGGDGSLSVLDGNRFTPLLGSGVAAVDEFGSLLVAGFSDGSVGLLSADGTLLARDPTGFTDQPSALLVLENGDVLDIYVTERGGSAPLIVSFPFIAVVTELPPSPPEVQGTGLPGTELLLVATLLSGDLTEVGPANQAEPVPGAEVFALFLPPGPVEGATSAMGPVAGTEGGPGARGANDNGESEIRPPEPDVPGWERYPLGVSEALRQRGERRLAAESLEDLPEVFPGVLDRLPQWLTPPPAAPTAPAEQRPPEAAPRAPAGRDGAPSPPSADPPATPGTAACPEAAAGDRLAGGEPTPAAEAPHALCRGEDESVPAVGLGVGAAAFLAGLLFPIDGPRAVPPGGKARKEKDGSPALQGIP
jgi:hypothetical protein